MRKFECYPVYVNHPGRWNEVRQRQRDYFADKRDLRMFRWLAPDGTGARLYEILADSAPSPESREYESQVYQLLRLINSTRVGKLLLDSLDQNTRYWIVPKINFGADCNCRAVTFPGAPKEGGGIRIYLTPGELNSIRKRWQSADDILFHELVHAYRMGKVGYQALNWRPMYQYDDAEEFLALHMQNVYLAERGSPRFYRDYHTLQSVSKGTAYQYFSGNAEVLMALRYFVTYDTCLTATVAGWKEPADSFNPWRDQPILERMYLDESDSGIKQLPPF